MVPKLYRNLNHFVEIVRRLRLYSSLPEYNEEILFGRDAMDLPKLVIGAGEHPVDTFRRSMTAVTVASSNLQTSQSSCSVQVSGSPSGNPLNLHSLVSRGIVMRPPYKHANDSIFNVEK